MKTIAILTAGLICSCASAQGTSFYVGAGIGKSVAGLNGNDFSSQSAGVSQFSTTRDRGYKLFGGYSFSEYWAIEGGYADQGRFTSKWEAPPAGLYNNNIYAFDYKAASWFAAAKGTLPVTGTVGIFGKLGVTINRAKDTFTLDRSRHIEPPLVACPGGVTPSSCYPAFSTSPVFLQPGTSTKTRADVLVGVGVEYKAFERTSIRFEYEDFGTFGDSDHTGRARVTATTLSIVHRF